ncbi:transcriptional regulator [Trinickia dabaoshanensis]|uniref:Transcriptional regulator n=1 Tax=Trinickia dabaoshanensis TaxID=564714 RepID=A0A2N7VPD8_9BURK|nr:helix-turn-helix domain-containing protein [Trinickia dabaoshanensis]PMS19021.1 transcriptional regulator [Trinickia dabaoshanensis]
MVKRISHQATPCGVARPLDVIGDGWSLLIVRDAFAGVRRFGEFQSSLGLAKNILAARLRMLIEHGIFEAVPAADGAAHQEYVLTEKGRGLFPVLVALRQWGDAFCFEADEARARLLDKKTKQPPQTLEVRAQDGRLLAAEDTLVQLP